MILILKDKHEEERIVLEEGIEFIEEPEELSKEEFFNLLEAKPEGLELTITRLGKTYESRYKDQQGKTRKAFFIDYTFKLGDQPKQVGINYNLGTEVAENTFSIGSQSNLFKLLEIAIPELPKAKRIRITKEKLEEKLVGLKFIGQAKLIHGMANSFYIIEPIRKIEEDDIHV